MISTKNILNKVDDVPLTWAYETYCNLPERLTGQNVRIKSPLNPNDTNPSFFVYYKEDKYRWKDFSTGNGGNIISLLERLFNINTSEAIAKLFNDYSNFLKTNKEYFNLQITQSDKYYLDSCETRNWNVLDAEYWKKYNIDSETLNRFNVRPIKTYVFKSTNEEKPSLIRSGNYIYGYYNFNNQLCKIYQPKSQSFKFLKIKDYVQGTDQLEFLKPNLVICSSLKDAMCFLRLGYNCEAIAPDSENTIIRKEHIDLYKKKYQNICTIMDNDSAGIKSMETYNLIYDIPFVHLKMEKDVSDSVCKFGLGEVRSHLTPLLREAFKK